MKKIFFLILLLVSSCKNRYGNYNPFYGGYSEKQIKQNIYLVSYKSMHLNNYVDTINLALLRASEISIKNNSDYFEAQPVKLSSVAIVDKFNTHGDREEISREAVIIINIKPKKINSEIVFNSRELCSLILSLDSDENWFNNKIIDCKLESQINRKELERKLKYYHKNFIDILKGDYIPK